MVAEINGGNITAKYLRGINLIAADLGGTRSYYLFNGHGDVTGLANPAGSLTRAYDYDAFGNQKGTIDPVDPKKFRYGGEYWDDQTGTYYLRARYYNPGTGRFISEDSVWGKDNDPLSLNLYTYCYNNPINALDPTGHEASPLSWKVLNNVWDGIKSGTKYVGKKWAEYQQRTYNQEVEAQAINVRKLFDSAGLDVSEEQIYTIAEGMVDGQENVISAYLGVKGLGGGISKTVGKIEYKSSTYLYKHNAPKNLSWKQVVESTKSGPAKYKYGTDIETLEKEALERGIDVNNGKPWKVYDIGNTIGAKSGIETQYIRVEISPEGTVHSHPITPDEFKKYTK